MSGRRIGLFGGTFDPPHNAHVALAHRALVDLALDELRWIPAGQPYQKVRAITPAAQREAMVREAIAGEPRFVLERCELERSGPSYTIDTVRALQARQPGAQWFLLVGADQYAGLPSWRDWRDLIARVTLAVAQRPGAAVPASAELRAVPVAAVALPPMDVSASVIRDRVAAGAPITDLVPPGVASYIDRHHLYRPG
ncbi:MAG: nicotinate-nucleotide adenylyltransferase [Piscinibacter sp.]|uniref:nicotinate-nucleotide adenylyltransferase n=1 Tax=Piscinibacter sp. TaxID=1903157 RepID=UPI00258DC408|nr:nicotinate-nucleotide adenylyltransferase [Piscinibacter sp.]MCW5662299.1 nicotinate-nucleotide adenylyltransferase [Piscinibacter sp.]